MIPQFLLHIATFGLGRSDREPLDASGVSDLVQVVKRSGVRGLAMASVLAGDLIVSDRQRDDLAAAQTAFAAIALELDGLMLRLLDALGSDGLLVLKGAAHAFTEYPDPAWRDYGDLDLYVHGRRLDDVIIEVGRYGFEPMFEPFAPRWSVEFGKSLTMQDGRLEIDLHRNLSQGLALGIRPTDVFARQSTVLIGGVEVPVLESSARFVHAAVHAMGGSAVAPLNGLVDLSWMSAEPDRVRTALGLAREWGVAGTFARAIAEASALGAVPRSSLAIVADAAWSPTERLRTQLVSNPNRRFRHDVAAGFLSLRTIRLRVKYAAALTETLRTPRRP